ncbi:hypothetical protein MHBO_000605 [Bonamia ostreae]|uniref:Protein kinase domain-containing protein n=2 Tax=Bonamia ostreae TaxID=126728 RepID=A0ABV2AG84_9EUKA
MFDKNGKLKLVDFDNSVLIGYKYPQHFKPFGTLIYTAPEQANGKIYKKTDWYNLANFMLYCMFGETSNTSLVPIDREGNFYRGNSLDLIAKRDKDFVFSTEEEGLKDFASLVNACMKIKPKYRIDIDSIEDLKQINFFEEDIETDAAIFEDEIKEFLERRKNFFMLY